MKKTIYVLEFEYNKYFLEDKEKAVEIWKLLTDSGIQKLCKIDEYGSDNDEDRCYYPEALIIELRAMKVEMLSDKIEARRVHDNIKKLRKTKILKTP